MDDHPDDAVVEEIERTCSGLGVRGTDVEDAAKQLYATYEVKRPAEAFAVACVGIAMQEYNSDIPLDFVVMASSIDDVARIRALKAHIETVLDLCYQSDSTDA